MGSSKLRSLREYFMGSLVTCMHSSSTDTDLAVADRLWQAICWRPWGAKTNRRLVGARCTGYPGGYLRCADTYGRRLAIADREAGNPAGVDRTVPQRRRNTFSRFVFLSSPARNGRRAGPPGERPDWRTTPDYIAPLRGRRQLAWIAPFSASRPHSETGRAGNPDRARRSTKPEIRQRREAARTASVA